MRLSILKLYDKTSCIDLQHDSPNVGTVLLRISA